MSKMKNFDHIVEKEVHLKLAKECFNQVWQLLDKEDLTQEEQDLMIHLAHASRFHWGFIGTAVNLARGEWQISRVYSTLNRPQEALYHAQRCLDICLKNKIGEFDLAYAYEALARSHSIAKNSSEKNRFIILALETAQHIKNEEDRSLLLGDLDTIHAEPS